MPPKVALIVGLCGIAAFLIQDVRWRPKISAGGWIPLVWVLVIGSRPLSSWFSSSAQLVDAEDYIEGSPMDRMFYLAMIGAGIAVLLSRRVSWSNFIVRNKWVALYFAYFALSVLWSDETFVSFKRWIKDFGQVVMVLVVLSEAKPLDAVKAVLVRASYVLIPMSVILVKYFPDLARAYDRWGGFAYYSGVTTDKNLLGMVLTTLGVSVFWVLLDLRDEPARPGKKLQALLYLTILAMVFWLLMKANSATAVVASALGATVLVLVRFRVFRNHGRVWLSIAAVMAVLLVVTGIWSGFQDSLLGYLGRDPTYTGRREIWEAVLGEHTNPFFGVGFYSFWTDERVERLSAAYHYLLNEAHSGYLEAYLNGGIIGLGLLCMLLWSSASKALSGLPTAPRWGIEGFRLTFVVVAVIYSFSEAIASRLDLVWFGLLLATCVYDRKEEVRVARGARSSAVKAI